MELFLIGVFHRNHIRKHVFDIVKRKDYFKWKKIEVLNRATKKKKISQRG